jgi:type VI secretion system protein ImpF
VRVVVAWGVVMAELTTSERLQPSLLDRLTDDEPGSRAESRDRRVMSMRQIRLAVLRDLSWLLNAASHPLEDEIQKYPLVAKSVVNFGVPDLTGLTSSGIKAGRLEQMVLEAIVAFEPRITRKSLSVRAVEDTGSSRGESNPNRYRFEINGELCPIPMPESLYLKTEVDLETGRFEVKDRVV